MVKKFAIGFGDASFDESEHAWPIASHFETDHHEDLFAPDVMLDLPPDVFGVVDKRFADPSMLPTYLPCGSARAQISHRLGNSRGASGRVRRQ